MARVLTILVDDDTEARLLAIASELGRDVDELAAAAVSETALDHFRKGDFARDPVHGQAYRRARAL